MCPSIIITVFFHAADLSHFLLWQKSRQHSHIDRRLATRFLFEMLVVAQLEYIGIGQLLQPLANSTLALPILVGRVEAEGVSGGFRAHAGAINCICATL